MGLPGIDTLKKVGGAAVNKVKDVGGKAVDKAKDVGGKAVDVAKDAGGKAVGVAKDAVEFTAEADQFVKKQQLNFGKGVLEWGKSSVSTVVGLASNPVDTAKAVGKLATNPVLNPVGGTVVAAVQGKNPVEAYREGGEQLKGIGEGLVNDYKQVYKDHGAAGVAGYLAPDIALAVLSGGGSAGAKGAGTAAAKGVAKEVAEETVEKAVTREVAEEVVQKSIPKEVAKSLAPGPEDVADGARKEEHKPQNYLEALISNFQFG